MNTNTNDIITAKQYNSFIEASKEHFNNEEAVEVKKDVTVISKSLSDQLDELINNNKFSSSVCDICNTGSQHSCSYNCECNYNCCNHNCSCNHQCSCNKPSSE
jgi:hypothetical protein